MRSTVNTEAQLTIETCDYCGDSQEVDLHIGEREYCPNTGTRWPTRFTVDPRSNTKLACAKCIRSGAYLEGTSGELLGQWNLKGPGDMIVVALLPVQDNRALLLRDSIMHWWAPASLYDATSTVYNLVHRESVVKFSAHHQQRIVMTFLRTIERDEIAKRLGENVAARMYEKQKESIEVEWSLITP